LAAFPFLQMGVSKSNPTFDLQQIVDVIPQMITVLAPDGTIAYANQAVLDYTGLTIDDVMNCDFRDRVFHPEDIERLRDERQQAMVRGEPFENEQRARGKDGEYQIPTRLPMVSTSDSHVVGEGSGIMILEELEHARRRGARVYAEIVGYGMTADAYHISAPDETQGGVIRSMQRAIRDAGITPQGAWWRRIQDSSPRRWKSSHHERDGQGSPRRRVLRASHDSH
jgi:PAS domain S-box-containing protein